MTLFPVLTLKDFPNNFQKVCVELLPRSISVCIVIASDGNNTTNKDTKNEDSKENNLDRQERWN